MIIRVATILYNSYTHRKTNFDSYLYFDKQFFQVQMFEIQLPTF